MISISLLIFCVLCVSVRCSLPFWHESNYTDLAAAVQDTYCNNVSSSVFTVGSDNLLESLEYGDGEQKINVYHSEIFGIVVAYQGTNTSSVDDMSHDMDTSMAQPDQELGITGDSMVFHGWLVQFRKSWSDLKAALHSALAKYPGDKVVVTGHSMGGAIAQLGALAINHEFGDVIDKIVSFAPPRVGNHNYTAAFDNLFKGTSDISRYTGVWNGNDFVPSLPPTSWGYFHPSGMIWIHPENGTSYSYYPNGEDPAGPAGPAHRVRFTDPYGGSGLYVGAHLGYYMRTHIGGSSSPCPAVGGGG